MTVGAPRPARRGPVRVASRRPGPLAAAVGGGLLLCAALAATVPLLGGGSLSSASPPSPPSPPGMSPAGVPSSPAVRPSDRPSDPATVRPSAAPSGRPAPIGRFRCPSATTTVSSAVQLREALAGARPGQVIELADGVYSGRFTVPVSGTAAAPIYLCGSRAAILQGSSIATGYALHLVRVAHWRISGFTLRQAQKGVVLDASTDVGLQDLLVERIGDEGVHLRTNSSANVVRGLTVRDVGQLDKNYGEGIYIGSARSNWGRVTGGQPDRSDGNYIVGNRVSRTTAESVDVKEGTTAGVIDGNQFDGAGMSAATTWVNVKGNDWVVSGNRGEHSPRDGFVAQAVLAGWGRGNLFTGNRADLSGNPDGVGFRVQPALGNTVRCDNTTVGGRARSTIACAPAR